MKHTGKRIVSLLLCLMMVLTLVPGAAFASDPATATLVTDVSTLAVGDKVIIANGEAGYALGTNQKSNNREAVSVTVEGSAITYGNEVQVLTLAAGITSGTWAFSTGSGYLYAAGQSTAQGANKNQNYLKTQETLDANGSFAIAIETNGTASVIAQGDNGCNVLQFNNGTSKLFSCYSTASQKDVQLYKVNETSTEEPEQPEQPEEPEEPVVYADKLTELPGDGDTIIIYNSGNALGAAASGKKLAGVAAEAADGKLPIADGMAQLLVTVDGDNYIFTLDGKYLTSADTGNGLSFTDTLTDCGKWTFAAATDGTWYIKNVGANYNGNYNQAMEYYSGFTTYGIKETAIYQMELYLVEKAIPTADKMSALPGNGDTIIIYNSGNALGAAASGKKLAGVAAEAADGKLPIADGMAQLLVTVDGDNYIFTLDGKYLTSADTGNGLSFTDTLTDCGKWTFAAATDGTWYIKNVGANYNGNYNQAMEYYSGFTTYGIKETAIYQMELYLVSKGQDGETPVDPPVEEEPTVNTVAEALAGADGASFTVKGVVTLVDGKNIYVQDATGGICVRMSASPSDIALGDTIIATGSKTVYSGLPQLGSGTYEKSEGLTLEAKVVSDLSTLTTADICCYIKLVNMEITEVYDNNGAYSTPNITVKDASGNQIQLYKAVTTKTGDAWDWKVGDVVSISGAMSVYNTTLQMRNTLATEIEAYVPVETGKVTSADSFTSGSYVMVVSTGYAPGVLDGTWITAVQPVIVGNEVTNPNGGIWTLTVEGSSVTITDANGASIAPKGGNSNGITASSGDPYQWAWAFDEGSGTFTFSGVGSDTVILASNKNSENKFRAYKTSTVSGGAATYPTQFTLYRVDPNAAPGDTNEPAEGAQVVIYNLSAEGVLAAEGDNQVINSVLATIEDSKATPANGGVVFTVSKNGDYFRFYNETYGYLCSNGTGNNAFYSLEASEDADWKLTSGKKGGWNLESRTAKFNGTYSQYLEYYSDSYKTYSMYNVTDYDIYEFFFYPVTDAVAGNLTGGIVNKPAVDFGTLADAYVGSDYTFTFVVDAVFGVAGELEVKAGETVLTANGDGSYTIPAGMIVGESITVTVTGVDTKGVAISGQATITVKDEPVIGVVTPAANAETGEDLRPVISAVITNAGADAQVTMTVNGAPVDVAYDGSTATYTPAADLAPGRTSVTVTVTRTDSKTTSKTWSFTVGEAQYQLYFGQLHSHTTYSDGSGSLESALEYIGSLPDSAKVDFVAFTDHSNYFDTSAKANPEGALYDMSLASSDSQALWNAYKGAVAEFNARQSDVIALGGFEMTWSGGPGHINTFATEGIVSRNNTTLNNKTGDAGLQAYYDLLSQPEGVDSISQLNHPGSTFGTFADFAYYDAIIDTRVYLVEVGNGEGQVGAGGYFPSYEYYTMALDKGWHVAPSNNQDNHKGKWGNANDARNVILTDDFSEEGIYEAIRNYRVYSTEDKNLEIGYTVNGQLLGTIIGEVPDSLELKVNVYDPDSSDSISKVEVIVNSGRVAYTWDDPAVLATGELTATLSPDYSYYYIRVTQGDGDLAVTAPVWVGETVKLGISSVECATSTPVTDEELTINTTLFNSESETATVTTVTYTSGGQTLYTDTTGYTIAAYGTLSLNWNYTPTLAKLTTITVTADIEQGGVGYTFTMDIVLDVQDASKLVYIGIDASHYNEYVNGNYKDNMGNFGLLAAGYNVRTVTLYNSEDLIAACSNEKYVALILTAPSRRSSEAQASDPLKVYTADELAAIVEFNANGGAVILAGWSDHYENYPSVESIKNMTAAEHMAATQNAVLEALGSSLRIADDATYDDSYNGGQAYRLYFNTYGDSFLTAGVEVDPENPHDRLYTEVFSDYGGASVYTVDGTLPDTVTPLVYGHSTTYSVDVDKDGLGGDSVYKYEVTEGDSRLMVMASEQLEGKGLIIVSGSAFMSNFEVQATIEDSGSEKNYSNYKICENLVQYLNPVVITPIAEVQAQTEAGYKYTIEGVVTSNASGYDKDTAFFDCIYIQDATGGICCFPVAGNYKIGDLVRITGTTDFYQGEMELQVTSIEVIGEAAAEPTAVTAAQINDRSVQGQLVTLTGTVVSYELANGLIQTIMVRDDAGDVARVFIDGYITTAQDVRNLFVGCRITVTGLASYDDTFNAPDGPFARIRIRDRADVVCSGIPVIVLPEEPAEPEAELPFTDVAESDEWYDAVVFVVENGLMIGVSDTEFAPDSYMTRAMLATVLWRLEGEPVVNYLMQYEDVAEGLWYSEAIRWASAEGIVNGYGDNTFGPNDLLTRQQLAAILCRYALSDGRDVSAQADLSAYADGEKVASWATDAMAWAVKAGLLETDENGLLDPNGNASRKEIALLMKTFCEG